MGGQSPALCPENLKKVTEHCPNTFQVQRPRPHSCWNPDTTGSCICPEAILSGASAEYLVKSQVQQKQRS